jgi:ubiquinone/menaquinone biosynthesis C-methylase UbiE
MKRRPTAELLDSDAGSPAEIDASFRDLARINRWFGGISTTQAMIDCVRAESSASTLSLLDVASGNGDVPRAVAQRVRSRGLGLSVTHLDRSLSHMNGNRRAVAGNALALPFRDEAFDLVHSCLFVHHLQPAEVRDFIDESLRVCRRAVLINDLIRDPVHQVLVEVSLPLYRSRITRHDAPASVRQAYTVDEMRQIVGQTQARSVAIRRHYLYRMAVIAWKK